MSDRKAVIKNADMGEEMQQDAVDCATQALEKYNIEKVSFELIRLEKSEYFVLENAESIRLDNVMIVEFSSNPLSPLSSWHNFILQQRY